MPELTFAQNNFEVNVRKAIEQQMHVYPKSTLKDLYKHFFQDKYGPGHMINDTDAAKNYLLKELNSYTEISGVIAEPTGWEHNFYRVNLSVIKNELIPFDLFFDAFVRSVNNIKPVSIEEWKNEWLQIEAIIKSMNLLLPDYVQDSEEIQEKLKEGKYVGHHSKQFNETYNPHYRIIDKEIFEKELLPLLESDK